MKTKQFSNMALVIMLTATVFFTLIVGLLLSTPSQRTEQFWISIFVFIFCEIISFLYAIYFFIKGSEEHHPVPALFGLGTVVAMYFVGSILVCIFFWLLFPVALNWYIALHIGMFLILVLLGGAAFLFLSSAKTVECSDKGNRTKIVELQLMISDALHSLSVLPDVAPITKVRPLLSQLQEMIRFSDPNTPIKLQSMDNELYGAISSILEDIKHIAALTPNEILISLEGRIKDTIHKLKQRNKLVAENK